MKAKLADWVKLPFEELENDTLLGKGFRRNRELIDLSKTPDSIKDKIIEEFKNQANKKRDMIFNYLINNKCKQLVEHVNEF